MPHAFVHKAAKEQQKGRLVLSSFEWTCVWYTRRRVKSYGRDGLAKNDIDKRDAMRCDAMRCDARQAPRARNVTLYTAHANAPQLPRG